jgi:hypothetical protein
MQVIAKSLYTGKELSEMAKSSAFASHLLGTTEQFIAAIESLLNSNAFDWGLN